MQCFPIRAISCVTSTQNRNQGGNAATKSICLWGVLYDGTLTTLLQEDALRPHPPVGTKLALCCPAAFHFPDSAAGALLAPLSPAPDHRAFQNAPPVAGPAAGLSQPRRCLGPQYQTTHPAPNGPRGAKGRTDAFGTPCGLGSGGRQQDTHKGAGAARDGHSLCRAQCTACSGGRRGSWALCPYRPHQELWPLTHNHN